MNKNHVEGFVFCIVMIIMGFAVFNIIKNAWPKPCDYSYYTETFDKVNENCIRVLSEETGVTPESAYFKCVMGD